MAKGFYFFSTVLFLFLNLNNSFSEMISLESRITAVHPGKNDFETTLIFLENNGRVLHVSPLQKEELKKIEHAFLNNENLKLKWKSHLKEDFLLSVEQKKQPEIGHPFNQRPTLSRSVVLNNEFSNNALSYNAFYDSSSLRSVPDYSPTHFKNLNEVNNLFVSFREKMKQNSECYQRAHTWAFESYNAYNVHTMKVFVFFTQKYIREYDYKWWFHVSPFTYLENEEFVLDRTFTQRPLKMQEWTNLFMEGKWICPTVARYSDYSLHQNDQYCYLRKVPMYYFQPLNVEQMDDNVGVGEFIDWEVKFALKARKCGLLGCDSLE